MEDDEARSNRHVSISDQTDQNGIKTLNYDENSAFDYDGEIRNIKRPFAANETKSNKRNNKIPFMGK